MWIIERSRLFIITSLAGIALAVLSIVVFGLHYGVDFTGGSLSTVTYTARPDKALLVDAIGEKLPELAPSVSIQTSGEDAYIVRTGVVTPAMQTTLQATLSSVGEGAAVSQFSTIGPTIGKELREKSLLSIALVLVAIILFVAFAFRKVGEPVSSWYYGLAAIFALVHDILIPTGVFALLGHLAGVEVDVLFVTALLTILGFSVHDTIVVFDRIRERLSHNHEHNLKESFKTTTGMSVSQTITRSINTSLTTLFVLATLFWFGGESTRWFSFTMMAGILAGTYSSIFFASPLLVLIANQDGTEKPKDFSKKKK